MDECFIFTHIPKVAGSSLRRQLENPNFDQTQVKRFRGMRDLWRSRHDDFALLIGHSPYGMHHFIDRPCRYFTMLRDPIERAISHYFFIKQPVKDPVNWGGNAPIKQLHDTTPLKDMFRHTSSKRWRLGGTWLMDNLQTRYLAGFPHFWRGEASSTMLRAAKYNLRERFAAFGLLERYDTSVLRIADAFGWRIAEPPPEPLKKTHLPKSIDCEDRAAVIARNQLDQELYAYALDLFERGS